ncbi:hypothetical protein Tco_0794788 [Tanacetum coccineum]
MSNTNTNLPTQTSSVLHNDTVSTCSTSKVQEKTQLSRSRCMNSLREVKSQFKFLTETLHDFGVMPIFKRTFSQDLDLLEQHLTKYILSQTDCKTILTKLRTTFENAFNSEFKERMQKYIRFDAQSFKDAMISLNVDSLKVDLVAIQNTCSKKEDNNSETASSKSVKESSLDSAKKDFTLDYDSQVTDNYFAEYTGIKVKQFRDTLLQLMDNVKKSVSERTQSNGTESEVQDDNSRSGNDIDADDADIRPIYDEEPMVEDTAY